MENALATIDHSGMIPARSMADVVQLGELFERSGMFGCTQQGQGAVLVLTCMSEKISPLQFKRTYHLVEGTPSMRADAMLAKFVEIGGKYVIRENSDTRAAALFTFGENSQELEVTWEQALKAGWPLKKDGKTVKDNWAKTPYAMLWARLVSKSVRLLAPGVNAGCYTPEEVADFDAPPARREVQTKPAGMTAAAPASVKPAPEVAAQPVAGAVSAATPADKAGAIEATAAEVVDFGVAPIGKIAGKRWDELETAVLEVVAKSARPEIVQGHRDAIATVIASRKIDKAA